MPTNFTVSFVQDHFDRPWRLRPDHQRRPADQDLDALDLPTVPATAQAPNLQGGTHVSELITLGADEKVLCLTTLTNDSLGLALGTAQGVVKRVNPEVLGKDSWDVIRLEPGDRVVGAVELTTTEAELVFMTNDAQLLRFPPRLYDRRVAREAAWPASNSASAPE